VNAAHIYDTRGETLFKAACLLICSLGVYFAVQEDTQATTETLTLFGFAMFVFAVSLFMEFANKLVISQVGIHSIHPFLHILFALSILVDSICLIARPDARFWDNDFLTILLWLPFLILFVDLILILFVKKSEMYVENNLV